MAAIADRRVAVRRLRIRGGGADPLRLQLGVDRLLAAAELRPAGLPPAAILVVRSLADPLPGRLDCRAVVPPDGWQRAVAAALGGRAARAARPASGFVPGDADAVLFADRSELLACLGRAWCDGSLARLWWWRALGLATPRAALQAFADTPEAVPAALARLASGGTAAVALAARLQPAEAAALARAMAAAWGAAPALGAALADGERGTDPGGAVARAVRAPVVPHALAPWRDLPGLEPAAVAALGPEQEALLGVALALSVRPAAVRAPAFAAAARAWRAARRAPAVAPPRPRAVASERYGAADEPRPRPPEPTTIRPRAPARPPAVTRARPHARSIESSSTAAGRPAPDRPGPTARAPARAGAAAAMPTPVACDAPAEPPATTVRTELGGLFQLVRVGQLLGLYGDFTTPAAPGIALPLWDFVTLLGGRLLAPPLRARPDEPDGRRRHAPPRDPVWALLAELGGRRRHAPPRDPVWALLAELGGRGPDEPAGRGYRPPRAWRVPREWIEPFPARGTWRCARGAERLVLVHPAGFTVVDAAGADLERELRRYRRPGSARVRMIAPAEYPSDDVASNRPIAAPGRAPAARERWLGHLAAYVRARLAVALCVAPRAAARLALRRPAVVHVTPTTVDVVSRLEDLPIEVRLAGLDRDPGYVPAAGRSLRFHFE